MANKVFHFSILRGFFVLSFIAAVVSSFSIRSANHKLKREVRYLRQFTGKHVLTSHEYHINATQLAAAGEMVIQKFSVQTGTEHQLELLDGSARRRVNSRFDPIKQAFVSQAIVSAELMDDSIRIVILFDELQASKLVDRTSKPIEECLPNWGQTGLYSKPIMLYEPSNDFAIRMEILE